MTLIHVSLNELENASYNALESLKYGEGFCIAISKSLAFLKEIGVDGVFQFVEFLLSCEKKLPTYDDFSIAPYETENSNMCIFDGKGKSCIHYIEICVEYIVAQIKPHSYFTMFFRNSFDYIFLVPYLQRFSNRPISIQWYDEKMKLYNTVFIFPKKEYPEFFSQRIKALDDMKDRLIVHESEEHCDAFLQKYADVHREEKEFALFFQKSIKEGVTISKTEWEIIQTFAKNVLVPNSDASRQGAGEVQDTVDREDLEISLS